MECLTTTRSLKINRKKSIGTVVLLVEGEKDEFEILKQIFRNLLHYQYIEKKRSKKLKSYDQFVMKGQESSKVIVINLKNSNIQDVQDSESYQDEIYRMMYEEYGIDLKNKRIYFVWDRDACSNSKKIVGDLVKILGNSYENDDLNMQGLLLLSYPSIQSFLIDNFEQDHSSFKEEKAKDYVQKHHYSVQNINIVTLKKSIVELHKKLLAIGIPNYHTEHFAKTNTKIFEYEEQVFEDTGYYRLLSLVAIILIDLEIITER